eukprot:255821_1
MGCSMPMGCGMCPDRRNDDGFESIASRPLLKTPSTFAESAETQTLSFATDGSCNLNDCKHVERVMAALKYYNSIDIIKHQEELITFVTKQYLTLVDDWHHLVIVHENNISHIYNLLLKKYDILECKIHKCVMVQRNQLDLDNDVVNYDINNDAVANIELTYWIRVLDGIHCHLLHGYDYGYLTNIGFIDVDYDNGYDVSDMKDLEGDEDFYITSPDITSPDTTTDNFSDCSDPLFAQLKSHIIERQKFLVKMNVYERAPCKYNILTPQDEKFHEIASDKNKKPTNKGSHYQPTDCNVGLKFYYWDHYKNRETYIEKKYANAKEEILNNIYFTINKEQYSVGLRITERAFSSKYAKSLRATFKKDRHYGIKKGSPIQHEHIAAMILYCNHDQLACRLLRTYETRRANEQLFAVKKRHQEFVNWSRLLRETVDYYGTDTVELGSCYIGVEYIIVPAIKVRLRAPISTSKYLSVVLRFLNDMKDGIIIEIGANNYMSSSYELSGFACNWLCNFSGENEVIFMGGKHTMKICSIRNVYTTTNYENYCRAVYYFDLMLMGVEIPINEIKKIKRIDYQLLNHIIIRQLTFNSKRDLLLNDSGKKNDDINMQYMEDMFEFYCNNKKTVIINLRLLQKCYKVLRALIISERINNLVLFNLIALLFPNLDSIGVNAMTNEFKFDLNEMYKEIAKPHCKHIEKIQLRCTHIQQGSWLANAWNKDIEYKFYTKKFKAKFAWNEADDVVTLSKRKKGNMRKSKTVEFR